MRSLFNLVAVMMLTMPGIVQAASIDQCRNQALPSMATDLISLKTKQLNDLKAQIASDTNKLINLTLAPAGESACTRNWKTLLDKLYVPSLVGITAAQYSVNSALNDFSSQLKKFDVAGSMNCTGNNSLAKFMKDSGSSANKEAQDLKTFIVNNKSAAVSIKSDALNSLDKLNQSRAGSSLNESISAATQNKLPIPDQISQSLVEVESKQNGWGILWAIEDCNGYGKQKANPVDIKKINLADYGITPKEAKKYFKKPASQAELTYFKIKKNAYAYSAKLKELMDAYKLASSNYAECNKALTSSNSCKSAQLEEGMKVLLGSAKADQVDGSDISTSRENKSANATNAGNNILPASITKLQGAI